MILQIINNFENDFSCIWNELHHANEHKLLATGKLLHGQYLDLSTHIIHWFKDGYRHRAEFDFNTKLYLPATYSNNEFDSEKSWWLNGQLHRVDGPAIENSKSTRVKSHWWIYGKELSEEEFNCHSLVIIHREQKELENNLKKVNNKITKIKL